MTPRQDAVRSSTTTLTLVDGVRIIVPDSLNLITPYVLQEQQDWFEEEIKFLRRLLQPGQKVIDIGANYGVYALSTAQTVGPTGCVWAFEPTSSTARLLAGSIIANDFRQVVLETSALSSRCGSAQMTLHEKSELNALVRGKSSSGTTETVALSTLDACLERYDWRDIAFVKIDAEGEEANILTGGRRFFAQLSPLVQYEVKAGTHLHLELVHDFAALGYASYRLVPGVDVLVPFRTGSPPDGYLLNLFCCKRDCAERLAAAGRLLYPGGGVPSDAAKEFTAPPATKDQQEYNWRHTIARLPYGMRLAPSWERTMAAGRSEVIDEALSLYARSRDTSLSAEERFGALEASFNGLKVLCDRRPSHLRLASLARVARDYGARSVAVAALNQLITALHPHGRADVSEPFLAPGARFDQVQPRDPIDGWVLAAVLEAFERLGSFSSFYTGSSARQRLETINALGYGDAEMERRLSLLRRRLALPRSPRP